MLAAQTDATDAHRWRSEYAEVCGLLTGRLQELAEFLDSLLKHKDVLGVLAQDRRKAMRKAIDRSLDLSNSLNNLSFSVTGRFSLNETSLLHQLSSLSTVLNNSVENKENLLNGAQDAAVLVGADQQSSSVVDTLRAEIKFLKTELDKNVKKERKSLTNIGQSSAMIDTKVDPNSESEAWSEPDRKVSSARMGLDESAMRCLSINRSPKKFNINESSNSSSENESGKLLRKNAAIKCHERISDIELLLSEKDNAILKQQCQLVESDNRLKEERLKLLAQNKELQSYKQVNEMLEIEIEGYKGKMNSENEELNSIRAELANYEAKIASLTNERDTISVDLRVATRKLATVTTDLAEIKERHQKEIDMIMTEHGDHIQMVKQNLIEKHRADLLRDYVQREEYEEQMNQFDVIKKRAAEAESTIEFLKETEAEMSAQILDSVKNIRVLKKSLDEATIQASKVVLERTKMMTEKLAIEQRYTELQLQLEHTIAEKSELNARIAQLERTNASIQNRLVSNDGAHLLSRSTSNRNVRYNNATSPKQGQSGSEGGVTSGHLSGDYTSDEIKERLENSSPDLGIESDAGRTSGSEKHKGEHIEKSRSQFDFSGILIEADEESKNCTDIFN